MDSISKGFQAWHSTVGDDEAAADGALDTRTAELRALFDSLDTNGDCRVTRKEWGAGVREHQQLLARHFGGASLAEVAAAFKRIDGDGSGDLTWNEFMEAARAFRTN